MRKTLLALCLAAAACCTMPAKQHAFYGQPLEPEGWWKGLFNEVKHCAAVLKKDDGLQFEDISFYIVPPGGMGEAAGIWSAPRSIYLDTNYSMNAEVLRHEFAHAILNIGDNGHEDIAFLVCSVQQNLPPATPPDSL